MLSFTGALWRQPSRPSFTPNPTGLCDEVYSLLLARSKEIPPNDWLNPSIDDLHDPYEMRGMSEAVDRIRRAVEGHEAIRIITDYDVDGTTSSLILQATLRLIDPTLPIDFHIPSRFDEGYGFSVNAAQKAAQDGIRLIITADIGVRDHEAINTAKSLGLDVLVCDHHLPAGETVPENALVLCPPQIACSYPNPSLAACGVSLKLAQALLCEHPQYRGILLSLLKLAAIGTVADLVPLNTRENRAIVTIGIRELNQGPHSPGLSALIAISQLNVGSITASDLSFRLVPRINAAGRIDQASLIVELLTCRDVDKANELAQTVDQLNQTRRSVQNALIETALAQIGDSPDPFVLLSGPESEGWHRGVVGIVAARVKESTFRPTAILSEQGVFSVGSVRSIPTVHAIRALSSADDLLVKYGGHPAAAGFTVKTADIPALRDRLCEWVKNHDPTSDDAPVLEHDLSLSAEQLSDSFFNQLQRLGPYGKENPRPLFVLSSVKLSDLKILGKAGKMVKGRIPRQSGGSLPMIWWDAALYFDRLRHETVDLLGTLESNTWRGRRTLQFRVQDARVSQEKS